MSGVHIEAGSLESQGAGFRVCGDHALPALAGLGLAGLGRAEVLLRHGVLC